MIKLLIFSATLLVVAEASKWGQQQRSNNRRLITWKSAQKQFSKRQKDWNDGYAWKFDTDEEMVEGAPVSAYQHVTARCNDQYPKYSVPWATCISNGFRKVSHYNDAARFDIDEDAVPFDIAAPQRFRGVPKERCFCSNGGDGSGACTTVKYCNSRSDGGYRCSKVDNGCNDIYPGQTQSFDEEPSRRKCDKRARINFLARLPMPLKHRLYLLKQMQPQCSQMSFDRYCNGCSHIMDNSKFDRCMLDTNIPETPKENEICTKEIFASAAFCLKQKVKTRFNRWCFAKGPYIP